MRRAVPLVLVLLAMLVVAASPAGAHPQRTIAVQPQCANAHEAAAFTLAESGTLPAVAASVDHQGAAGMSCAVATPIETPHVNHALVAASSLPGTPWAALVAVAGLGLLVVWRPRAVIALTLALVLGALAFEMGVHSTHHLERPDEAARCVVAGASAKLSADLVDVTLDVPRLSLVLTRGTVVAPPLVVARVVPPDAGRAPPVLSA
jgi:hypothetical protein